MNRFQASVEKAKNFTNDELINKIRKLQSINNPNTNQSIFLLLCKIELDKRINSF